MLVKRQRRWSDVVSMSYTSFVFAEHGPWLVGDKCDDRIVDGLPCHTGATWRPAHSDIPRCLNAGPTNQLLV